MKRLAIIGSGTAGALALAHFLRYTNWHIQWYTDPAIRPQAVGEGSTLELPTTLYRTLGLRFDEFNLIDATPKLGIRKTNWGSNLQDFFHYFPPGMYAIHFNAVKLQNLIAERLGQHGRVQRINQHVEHEAIDADFIMDCSGRPQNYNCFHLCDTIPVNSVYVTQCYWDKAEFEYTLAAARPHGWVFGIPLQNRASIGYMYNNSISTLDDVRQDVQAVFDSMCLTPSEHTNSFSFGNYYRQINYHDRVAYNGNASFFLEPLEATSIRFMDTINRWTYDLWAGEVDHNQANQHYLTTIKEIETVIMLHYAAGSSWTTPFWQHAQPRGLTNFNHAFSQRVFDPIRNLLTKPVDISYNLANFEYGTWGGHSFQQNLIALGLTNHAGVTQW